jgi:hypothetical protein
LLKFGSKAPLKKLRNLNLSLRLRIGPRQFGSGMRGLEFKVLEDFGFKWAAYSKN